MPPAVPSKDGHLGHLTDAQTATLKELWALLFDVFDGILDQFTLQPTPSGGSSEEGEKQQQPAEKTKKERLGRLRSAVKSRVRRGSSSSLNRPQTEEIGSNDGQSAFFTAIELAPEQMLDALFRFVQESHPDTMVLRFMRARKWDVSKAAHMILSTIRWRVGVEVDEIIAKGEEALDRKTLESGKTYIHGVDYYGRPVVCIHVRKHKSGELPMDDLQRFTVWIMETARLLVEPPEETAALIFDLTDFTLPNMDFPYIKFLIQCLEAYYPECLGMLLIYNAPWVFSSVWKLIAPLLDPVVASKIHFVKNVDDLVNYLPPENIFPVFWAEGKDGQKKPPAAARDTTATAEQRLSLVGGNPNMKPHAQDMYEYTYAPPVPGENADPEATAEERAAAERERLLAERRFEQATRAWCGSARVASAPCLSARELDVVDIMRADAEKGDADLDRERALGAKELRRTWWKLDPYIRARTLYHRIGVIRKEGEDYAARWYSGNERIN